MKALLICPQDCPSVAALADAAPLVNRPLLGKSLVEYWLEYLAGRGAKQVCLLAADRLEEIRARTGDGSRWGLAVEWRAEPRELSLEEARAKYVGADPAGWLPAPDDVQRMATLPQLPERPLFNGYAEHFEALQAWLPSAATPDRIGVREVQPGIWVGRHTHIAAGAKLCPPCWLGEDVQVGAGARIGPRTILEDRAVVGTRAEVAHSVIGPATFVGPYTEVRNSIAEGNTLVNWLNDSCCLVPDAFLLCGLEEPRGPHAGPSLWGRLAALLALTLSSPVALLALLLSKTQQRPALIPRIAVRPRPAGRPLAGPTFIYYELGGVGPWLRRWPQLWSIVRGDLAWVGQPPLSPTQASRLAIPAKPVGLIAQADLAPGSKRLMVYENPTAG